MLPALTKYTPIAVVGASENPQKYGHIITRDLLKAGYAVTGVNPKGGMISGTPMVRSLAEVVPRPEMILCVVPPTVGMRVLVEAHALGIPHIWFQPGAESPELIEKAKELGISTTTQACFMLQEKVW